MKSFAVLATLVASEISQHGGDVGVPLKQILTNLPRDPNSNAWSQITPTNKVALQISKSPKYYSTRTAEQCTFPLEIVILQDLTDSFSDNIEEMKNVQLKQMVTGLSSTHPGSRFAMVSFQDKPIATLGGRDDACWGFHGDFTTEYEQIYDAYAKVQSYGGMDAPENQFGALMAAMGSSKLSWSPINSEYARLIVVVTDAGPHHADDGIRPADGSVLMPFPGVYTDAQDADLCLRYGYPSAQQVYNQVVSAQTYISALVFDGDWAEGWPANEWKKFNTFLAQPSGFVETDAEDSSAFWLKLSAIIGEMEQIECAVVTTPAPTTTPPIIPTTVAPTMPTTVPPTVPTTLPPTVPTTVPPTTIAPTVPTTVAPTMPPTVAPTMPTTVAPTMPTTVAPTVPTTVAPTMPTTVAPTMPTTVAPTMPTTVAPTMPTTVAPPVPTTVAPTVPTTIAPTMPTMPTTVATSECSQVVISDGCVPSADNCFCQPEVLIQLSYRPDEMNLIADDKTMISY